MNNNSKVKKFAGIEVASDLSRKNFFFLYLNTLFIGMLVVMPALLQPAFLKDTIKVSSDFFGFTNGFLQNMSQLATLAFVAIIGMISDKIGRKILAVMGFGLLCVFYYLYGLSDHIALLLHIPADISAKICAFLCFAPSRAAEFTDFAPGLFMAFILRFVIGIGFILCFPQFITMVADYTREKDRGKGMALNGIMMGLASIVIFAAIAPIGRKSGVSGLFVLSSVFAFVGLVSTWVFLKDRLPETKAGEKKDFKRLFQLFMKSPTIKSSYLCCMVSRADINVMATFVVAWAVQRGDALQLSSEAATQKGSIPMIVMGVVSFFAFPVIGILLDRWGRLPTIIATLFCSGAGLLCVAVCDGPFSGLMLVAASLVGIGISGSVAGANTLATDASPKEMIGTVLGGLNTMQPIGMLFFLQVGGYLYDVLGPGWAFGIKGAADILIAVWLLTVRKKIYAEMQSSKSPV
ncbi:MFS transporter [Thermodesulfobacteriota bacterium]